MRKWMIVLAILTMAITFGTVSAGAQTQISLGPIQGNSNINFVGTGANTATMTFGICPTTGACSLTTQDQLIVGGLNVGGFSTSSPSLSTSSTASFALATLNGANWTVAGPSMTYNFNGAAGTLNGTVVWDQVNTNGSADLVGTLLVNSVSGTLATYFTAGDTSAAKFGAGYPSGGNSLEGIFGAGGTGRATASINEGGAFSPSPTPEPSTILLFGTGLLGLGGILRRRLFA